MLCYQFLYLPNAKARGQSGMMTTMVGKLNMGNKMKMLVGFYAKRTGEYLGEGILMPLNHFRNEESFLTSAESGLA